MNIEWRVWTDMPNEFSFGHGVHFHDNRKPRETSLVAWIEGYDVRERIGDTAPFSIMQKHSIRERLPTRIVGPAWVVCGLLSVSAVFLGWPHVRGYLLPPQ